jgi:hemoglobin-like flavoprotein
MVTARQKSLVEASWRQMRPTALQVAELFYDRLFELDPLLEDSFKGDPTEQSNKLVDALGLAVGGLRDLDRTLQLVAELGRRHRAYGVRNEDYVTFGNALLWTLEQTLAEEFTPPLQEAWAAVYRLLSSTMAEAANGIGSAPAPASATWRTGGEPVQAQRRAR